MKGNTKVKNPSEYLNGLSAPRKAELKKLHQLIRKSAPSLKPFMMAGMIGYGPLHYKYTSGREGDWSYLAMASQKNYISMYFSCTEDGEYLAAKFAKDLPKASIGKSCVRFKRLEDVSLKVLEKMIRETARIEKKQGPSYVAQH